MPNSNYVNGQKVAYALTSNGKTPGILRADGYWCMMAAGSRGDHKIDVIAWKRGERLAIQCKIDGKIGPAERTALYESARELEAIPLVAYWHKEGRAAREVRFWRLLGPGLLADGREYVSWTPDHAIGAEA